MAAENDIEIPLRPHDQLTTGDLLARDWTPTLIKRFLPTADGSAPVNNWADFSGTKTYYTLRVWEIEQSENFGRSFLKSWRGRMKKRKPETVVAELRKIPKPCVPAEDETTTVTDEGSR